MATERRFAGKKLPLTIAFTVLLVAAFGAGCKGFFVAPTLTSITINPSSPSVQLGSTTPLQAFGVNSDGTGAYLTSGVSWSTDDGTVATVTGNGAATLTGVGLGTATITASAQSVQNTATVTVFIQISSMSISPQSQSIASGGTTTDPYIVTAVTSTGPQDISNAADVSAYKSGTLVTTLSCTYFSSGTNGNPNPGQYCSDDGTTPSGDYQLVATYTGTTQTATATLNVK